MIFSSHGSICQYRVDAMLFHSISFTKKCDLSALRWDWRPIPSIGEPPANRSLRQHKYSELVLFFQIFPDFYNWKNSIRICLSFFSIKWIDEADLLVRIFSGKKIFYGTLYWCLIFWKDPGNISNVAIYYLPIDIKANWLLVIVLLAIQLTACTSCILTYHASTVCILYA